MRKLLAVLFAVTSMPSSAQTPASPSREEVVRDLAAAIERSLDRETLMSVARQHLESMAASAALQQSGGSLDPETQRLVARELTGRALGVFASYFQSRRLAQDVVEPWLESRFTMPELLELAGFVKTSAGQKFLSRVPRLPEDLVARAGKELETDVTTAMFGAEAQDIMRTARIRRTGADMRTLATALEAYFTDHNAYPGARSISELKPLLSPAYIKTVPENDAWGRPLEYIVSSDRTQYRLVSGGADGVIDPDSRQITPGTRQRVVTKATDDMTGDLVLQDGAFHAAPAQLMAGMSPQSRTAMAPQPAPPGFERPGGEVRPPRLIRRVEPVSTEEARKARVSGIVILEVLIDAAGNVVGATILKPLPFGLDQAAVDAVRQWKFEPATRNGVPVPAALNLTVNFRPDDSSAP